MMPSERPQSDTHRHVTMPPDCLMTSDGHENQNNAQCCHVCDRIVVVDESSDPDKVDKIQLCVLWGSLKINMDRDRNELLKTVLKRLSLSLKKLQEKEKTGNLKKKNREKDLSTPQAKKRKQEQETTNPSVENGSGDQLVESASDVSSFAALEFTKSERSPLPQISGPGDVILYRDDGSAVCPESTTCGEGFNAAINVTICGENLSIIKNPPKMSKVGIAGEAVVGLPCVLSFERVPQSSPIDEFIVEWYSPIEPSITSNNRSITPTHCRGQSLRSNPLDRYLAYVGRWFVPRPEDVGVELLAKGFHRSMPCLATEIYSTKVKPSNPHSWGDRRLKRFRRTNEKNMNQSDVVRIASFNILADEYARTPLARDVMFTYCKEDVLSIAYRSPRISAELLDLDCDLFGLQECSSRFYKQTLKPLLDERYESRLTMKKSKVKEGCATFYDRRKFREIETHDFDFKTTLISDPHFAPLISEISKKWPHFLTEVLPHLSTIFQITVFEYLGSSSATNPIIIFSNTHLFYHAWAPHIRMIQVSLLFHRIALLRSKYQAQTNQNVGLILVGDFNSTHQSGAYQLLSKGFVTDDLEDWKFGTQFTWRLMKESEENEAEEQEGAEDASTPPPPPSSLPQEHIMIAGAPPDPILSLTSSTDHSSHIDSPMTSNDIPVIAAIVDEVDPNPGLQISSPAELGHLHDAYESNPNSFTNMVNGFCATLDHILISDSMFEVSRLLSPVSLEDGRQHGGLPSIDYPSDHISIAVELKIKN